MAEAFSTPTVRALTASAACAVAWRQRGQLFLTVIAKATFAFADNNAGGPSHAILTPLHNGAPGPLRGPPPHAPPASPMRRIAAAEIVRKEVHHGNHPVRSIHTTVDTSPLLRACDLLLTGHAHAPPRAKNAPLATQMRVRFALLDGQATLFDRALIVSDPAGFREVPLMFEEAIGGIDRLDNPLGAEKPRVVDAIAPNRPGTWGPVGRSWPLRKRLLGNTSRKQLDAPIAEIPDNMDWAYFQAAPKDQQVPHLKGTESVLLEGIHPTIPILHMALPNVRARARLFGPGLSSLPEGHELPLFIDTLRVDGDAQTITVVARSHVQIVSEAALSTLRVTCGVWSGADPISWPLDVAAGKAPTPPPDTVGRRRRKSTSQTGETWSGKSDAAASPPMPDPESSATIQLAPSAKPSPEERMMAAAREGRTAEVDFGRNAGKPVVPFRDGKPSSVVMKSPGKGVHKDTGTLDLAPVPAAFDAPKPAPPRDGDEAVAAAEPAPPPPPPPPKADPEPAPAATAPQEQRAYSWVATSAEPIAPIGEAPKPSPPAPKPRLPGPPPELKRKLYGSFGGS